MSNEQTEQFLDLWRQLENVAEYTVGDGPGSAVLRLCRQPRFSVYRDALDYCREVRNLLSHQPKVNGAYPVEPSQQVISLLCKVLDKLQNPLRMEQVMTPVQRMLTADFSTCTLPLIREMQQKGISHVPLMQGGKVVALFSKETFFDAVAQGMATPPENGKLAEYEKYLSNPEKSDSCYRFVSLTMEADKAEQIFQTGSHGRNKVRLLLVTQNGNPDKQLLGVVTPYDLLGDQKNGSL